MRLVELPLLSFNKILCVLVSKFPPSCGDVSSTTSTFASLVLAIAALAFTLAFTIVPSAIFAEVTASSAILPSTTDWFCSTAVLTVLLLGVPMFTALPKTTA